MGAGEKYNGQAFRRKREEREKERREGKREERSVNVLINLERLPRRGGKQF